MRFAITNVNVTIGGTAFTHGLTSDRGTTAVAPTEWGWNKAGAPAVETTVYRNGVPTATTFAVAAYSATCAVDFFCSFQHSTIR